MASVAADSESGNKSDTNVSDAPTSSTNGDIADALPPPPAPSSRLPAPAPGVTASQAVSSVPLTPRTPMTPARRNFRGSLSAISIPRPPGSEILRRSLENRSNGGSSSTQGGSSSEKDNVQLARSSSDIQQQGSQSQRQLIMSQSKSRGSGDAARSYKEMVEMMKSLHSSTDKLLERICQLHCDFADVTLKAAFLFDPTTVHIVSGFAKGIPANLPSPLHTAHFTRQQVDDNYERIFQRLTCERPGPETNKY
ncbi:unnamed protein product [Orchesella dallaii]|uniref:Uncharacterized protein n=1 Tax=Orchesella dallaii TaxID=48710 RepID=A0ABP1Q9K5_9HEXA